MKERQTIKFLFGAASFLFFLLIIVSFFILSKSPVSLPATQATPTPPTSQEVTPSLKKGVLIEKIETRSPLSQSESAIKSQLLLPLGGESGILYRTADFTIYYLSGTDTFQIRITTAEIDSAKREAMEWFRSKGFTDNGICQLIVYFKIPLPAYEEYFQKTQEKFNPFPEGC